MTTSNVGVDATLHEMERKPRTHHRRPVMPSQLDLLDTESGNTTASSTAEIPSVASAREPEPWNYMASQEGPVFDELVRIAREFAVRNGSRGVTVGEVVYEYERSGRRHGGVPMENKTLEQRQTSSNPRIMHAAGLVVSENKPRPSPVERQHRHKQPPWVLPKFARDTA